MSLKYLSAAQDRHNRLIDSSIKNAVEFIDSAPDMLFQFMAVYKGDLCSNGHNAPAAMLIDFMKPEAFKVLSLKVNFDKVIDRMIETERAVEQKRGGEYLIISIKPTEPSHE